MIAANARRRRRDPEVPQLVDRSISLPLDCRRVCGVFQLTTLAGTQLPWNPKGTRGS